MHACAWDTIHRALHCPYKQGANEAINKVILLDLLASVTAKKTVSFYFP